MSFRVFVVCEDHTLDQYVAKPVIEALLGHLGKPRSQVKVVSNPRLNGIGDVEAQFESIATRYAAIGDLLIFALDLDCCDGQEGRKNRRHSFDEKIAKLPSNVLGKVVVVLAVQELEVWALWGSRSKLNAQWSAVRAERDPKELYFDGMTTDADSKFPGKGRARLITESLAAGWQSLATGCPELGDLESQLRARFAA
ncbi:hypothetical protein [Cellulosimicrobium protaetiae]|uniref:DUF4276 family protein n=1 Tax=Cellulosimicrobium protaetiae TaxID=2587808 RepID=A0A6M5UI79_9MICO|nr:hypothetical protein [Cellulosimicrobium protaetiae]QJW37830.1 hypothetical protein FIC82_018300 [Cellulosimicrobium protaetiae]